METKVCRLVSLLVMGTALCLTPKAFGVGTPAGSTISNQAYADYKDANGNNMTRVYSNTVTTTVSQVAGVDVTPATASKTGTAGTQVWFAATVTNTGNGTDTINLTKANDQGWTVTLYRDTNGDGIWQSATETTVVTNTGALAADASYKVIVVVNIPAGAAPAASSNTTLTGTSQFNNAITDAGVYTTTALSAALEITKSATPANPKPGDTITYAITGKNNGTADALNVVAEDVIPANTTYVAGSIRVGAIGGTYATATAMTDAQGDDVAHYDAGAKKAVLNWGTQPPFPPNGAGTGGVFYFQVTVNSGVTATTVISNICQATYQLVVGGTTYTSSSNTTATSVGYAPAILLDPNRTGTADPGDQVVYAFTATNNGNASDTIDLTYTSSAGWTWTLWKDTNADGIPGNDGDAELTDTDGDGKIDTGLLHSGDSLPILAVTTVPAGVADQTVDTTTITGKSSIDTNVSDPEVLTTTVTAPVLAITKSVSPAGNQPPGTELTYTITVTNNGTGVATTVAISDIVPNFTAYKASSILTGATVATLAARTDDADGDGAKFDGGAGAVVTDSTTVGASGTLVLRFTVTIQ